MEFWGVEVKSGTPLNVKPGNGMVIHLSQASLGEVKANKTESVNLFVSVDGNKMVLGTLLSDKLPQQLFDLVLNRDFELSHNSKSGSVYFVGYKAENPGQEEGGEVDTDESDEEEEDLPLLPMNGKPAAAAAAAAAAPTAVGKPKVKVVEPTKVEKPEDDDDSEDDDSDEDSDEDGTSAGDLMNEDDESDSDDDSDSEEDDDTPKKVAPSKKRDAESEIKTPVSGKKAKLATPLKTDGKKTAHVATPHPSKQAGKTPANKASTPKSGGTHSCGSCNKGFGSENALQSHNKAKHSAGK